MKTLLFKGVGDNTKVDHVAVQTAYGMLIAATTLFKKLGYEVDPSRTIEGDWGKAVFLTKEGSLPIQLTDSSDETPIPVSESHLAIAVKSPYAVAWDMSRWAYLGGLSATIDDVGGGKYFVTIAKVLTIPIELVPQS